MYQEACFNQGTEAGGGGLMWATRSAPPVILCLLRAWICQGNVKFVTHPIPYWQDASLGIKKGLCPQGTHPIGKDRDML